MMAHSLTVASLLGPVFLLALTAARREVATGAVSRRPASAACIHGRDFDTDEHKLGSIYDSRVVGGIKLTF